MLMSSDIEKMRDQDLIAFSYYDNPNGSIENSRHFIQ